MPETGTDTHSARLAPQMPAAEAVRGILRRLLEALEAREAGTRAGRDPEELHDFRVAVRRIRSALGRLKGALPTAAREEFAPEFAWLGAATGPPRDMDVYLLKFPAYRDSLPAEVRDDLEPLRRFLLERQGAEQAGLVEVLDSQRYRRLKERWREFLTAPAAAEPPGGQRPLGEVADRRLRKSLRRVLEQGAAIDDDSPAENLHELRKSCKKLRYLLEFFQDLYPAGEAGRFIKALKGLQDNLGDFQDLEVQAAALREFSVRMAEQGQAPPATLLAMGMLIEGLRQRQQQARQQFAERFTAFAGAENRRLAKRLVAGHTSAATATAAKEKTMGSCLKGESENKLKEGAYQCGKCGAVSKKKDHLCKPDKLSKKDVKKVEGKDRKKKKED
ncbi:hypothetical protein DESUT3_38790 [Desulfuromonas versatilis]|uniref:CHAD domain-containing protein n=1 Tax=Desulfuromonas versatilis TaxID=2802975 RepID=A0ABN6E380_9BACT|nr:CHAD domain-containing protein [Desulfuromonas versatilis]BCR06810.1 hypothetical protein DESUT3_38790 [Desulfuromonas versatilis]